MTKTTTAALPPELAGLAKPPRCRFGAVEWFQGQRRFAVRLDDYQAGYCLDAGGPWGYEWRLGDLKARGPTAAYARSAIKDVVADAWARAVLAEARAARAGGAGNAIYESVTLRRRGSKTFNRIGVLEEAAWDLDASGYDADEPLRLAVAHVIARDLANLPDGWRSEAAGERRILELLSLVGRVSGWA